MVDMEVRIVVGPELLKAEELRIEAAGDVAVLTLLEIVGIWDAVVLVALP